MTVCVAAICENGIVLGASDRMITAGDVEFEPEQSKIYPLTTSIAIMIAGDAALQTEMLDAVRGSVRERIAANPNNWIPVKDVADWYHEHYMSIRNRRAENALLNPLGLDRTSFITNQNHLAPALVSTLADELVNFSLSDIQAIVAGVDDSGPHIYFASNHGTSCRDSAGFAAIGVGYWHANSQFMFAGHSRNKPFPDTLLLAYAAKRRAEVAPGVGQGTDMFVCGAPAGTYTSVGTHVLSNLERIYEKTERARESPRRKPARR